MNKKRQIIFFKKYFTEFYDTLSERTKEKIDYVLYLVSVAESIPKKFLQPVTGRKGLYEIRVEYESNIYRIFCCFDEGNIIVLFNGLQKKTQKTPAKELEKAMHIRKEYFEHKKKD
ncbi:MAG TPA: type II toxin-antitoxin system RelE/ParE family toxin [bacterium]|nr:type II toxin-antitoxin system RelE/ParE family toxin [bacterium]HPN41852.1 type II toxin-antitoxin system RelE/ParE family toxin [bacterium]